MAVGAHEDESSADGGGLSTKWAQGPGWAGRGGRHPTVELQKDDSRPLEHSAHTLTHAPHAASSDVGK